MSYTQTTTMKAKKTNLFINLFFQVNHSPSFHTDTQLDREVKEGLLTDTFTMLNIWQCDKRRVLEEDRKRIRDRLLQTNK